MRELIGAVISGLLAVVVVAVVVWQAPTWLDSIRVARSLSSVYDPAQRFGGVRAWDDGWQRLCVSSSAPGIYIPASEPAAAQALTASLAAGDFPAANQIVLSTPGVPGGRSASALLNASWLESATSGARPSGLSDAVWGTVLYLAGQSAARSGDLSRADDLMRAAEPLYGDDGPVPSLALSRCLQEWGRPDEARAELRRASPKLPADSATLADLAQEFVGDVKTSESWVHADQVHPEFTLEPALDVGGAPSGLDVNLDDLRNSPMLRTNIYWTSPDRPGMVQVQSTVVRNLVANGAFAWDYTPAAVHPVGFTASIYHNLVQVEVRDDPSVGRTLCLRRREDEPGVGVEGSVFPIAPLANSVLIQGGEVMTPDGAGFGLGRRWFGTQDTYPYAFLRQAPVGPGSWSRLAGAFTVSSETNGIRVWVLNYGPGGAETCFANLFLFEVSRPG